MAEFERKNIRLAAENYRGRQLYFVTLCFHNRRRFGTNPHIARWIIKQPRKHAATCEFFVHAYCVMPDHMHVLAAGSSDTSNLVKFIEAFKQETAVEFARKADAEGYAGAASLFRAAARAEKIHADNHAAVLRKLNAEPQARIEASPVRSTSENLMAAIEGETYERDIMYPEFLKIAQQEKNAGAIRTFQFALEAETEHARLFEEALASLEMRRPRTTYLVCAVCGFTGEKLEGARCPVCNNPKERFESVS